MSNEKNYSGGVPDLPVYLLVAFIVLKLCGVIDWSWWWVLSPFWIPCSLLIPLLIWSLVLRRKDIKRERDIKKIMAETGRNYWSAEKELDKREGKPIKKSRWQERLEEMQEKQAEKNN